MSRICNCIRPVVIHEPGKKDQICTVCGDWWEPRYGSKAVNLTRIEKDVNEITLRAMPAWMKGVK